MMIMRHESRKKSRVMSTTDNIREDGQGMELDHAALAAGEESGTDTDVRQLLSRKSSAMHETESHVFDTMEDGSVKKIKKRGRSGSACTFNDLYKYVNDNEDIDTILENSIVRFEPFAKADNKGGRKRGIGVAAESTSSLLDEVEVQIMGSPRVNEAIAKLLRAAMSKNTLFFSVAEDKRLQCILAMKEREVKAGVAIITQGDPNASHFYVVGRGGFDVLIQKTGEAEPSKVAHFGPGGSFGELALMYNRPRTATVKASENSAVWALSRAQYRSIILAKAAKEKTAMNRFLKNVGLFSFVPSTTLSRVADGIEKLELAQGTVLEGLDFGAAGANELYIVKQGVLDVYDDEAACAAAEGAEGGEADPCARLGTSGFIGIGGAEDFAVVDSFNESAKASTRLTSTKSFKVADGTGQHQDAPEDGRVAPSSHGIILNGGERCDRRAVASTDVTVLRIKLSNLAQMLRHLQGRVAEQGNDMLRAIISQMDLFSKIPPGIMEDLYSKFKKKRYRTGRDIVKEGEIGENFFVIVMGNVGVVKTMPGGSEQEVAVLQGGSYFGERALITRAPRNATCRAKEDVSCLVLELANFQELMPEDVLVKLGNRRYASSFNLGAENFGFDQLDIRDVIGVGTFGRVRVVVHRHTNVPYALKCIDKVVISQLEQHEHIRNEKNIMAELDHPFITKLHATFNCGRYLYLLLDLNLGGELFSLLVRRSYLEDEEAQYYAASILLAIEYLHDRKTAYRDLKPENIILDEKGFLKLVDFGFAKVIVDRTYTLCGTPDYLAPEIITNTGHGECVDWWSVGVFIYEMLAGYTPFTEQNTVSNDVRIYQNILTQRLQYPTNFNPAVIDLLSHLCSRDPSMRCGWATGTTNDLKHHRWFHSIDWDKLYNLEMPPPYEPPIDNPLDLSNFDEYENDMADEDDEAYEAIQEEEDFWLGW